MDKEIKPLHCPTCRQLVTGAMEQAIRERQSKAGQARWASVGERARSRQMKRVRAGEKIAA